MIKRAISLIKHIFKEWEIFVTTFFCILME